MIYYIYAAIKMISLFFCLVYYELGHNYSWSDIKITNENCRWLNVALKQTCFCNEGMTFIHLILCIPRTVPRSLIWWSFPAGFSSSCQYYFLWYHGLWNAAPVKCNEDYSSSMFRQTHSGYSIFPRSGEQFLSKISCLSTFVQKSAGFTSMSVLTYSNLICFLVFLFFGSFWHIALSLSVYVAYENSKRWQLWM